MASREMILEFPPTVAPVTAVRTTLIQSSLSALRECGHVDRYFSLLAPSYHEPIRSNLAPAWLPVEIALAHYAACDALDLEHEELIGIGHAVGDRIQGSYVGFMARSVKGAGITPWALLPYLDRIWARMFQGGAVAVTKVGPKDALVDINRVPLARIDYFRIAFSGLFIAGAKLTGVRSISVEPVFGRCGPDRLVYRAAWV